MGITVKTMEMNVFEIKQGPFNGAKKKRLSKGPKILGPKININNRGLNILGL